MTRTAEQTKFRYGKKANATPILPGEWVWVRNRNRQGQGKLHSGWDPEPHIVLETVGDTGLVYRVRPKKRGRVKVLHRNSLKPCKGALVQSRPTAPPGNEERPKDMPVLHKVPAPNVPGDIEDEQQLRGLSRRNLGVLPACYRL